MGSFGLRAFYVGGRRVALLYRRNLNQLAPSLTPYGASRTPYPLYNQVIWAESGGSDSYNAMELAATKKYGQNLTLSSSFTWAKDLTDTQDAGGSTFNSGTTFGGQILLNQFNRAMERSNNQIVVPRRFFAYAGYALPIGRGQHLLSNAPNVVQQIVGGWRTS